MGGQSKTEASPTQKETAMMSKDEEQLILEAAFSAVSDNILANQMHGNSKMWLQLSIDDKLLQYTSFLSHIRKDYRLGAIVGIFILIKNRGQAYIGEEICRVILEEIFASLADCRNQDALLIKCELEVACLMTEVTEVKSSQRLGVLRNLLQDTTSIKVHGLTSNVLIALIQIGGFDGLKEVIDIAERD